ncbi:outer membrane protein assembly factor BamE [Burkholderia cepacia]|uniref:outer membrane protein assembly factor BamE n=1 Tax=Burkholderia cepacia TaxID=292 RepID=UPI0015767A2F|nr:outer membrane protein assembly factor BamE [Burkholderia cepacia]NTX20459.1 outer membrane protein assembly factor BamE [Burkholderia cepacia]
MIATAFVVIQPNLSACLSDMKINGMRSLPIALLGAVLLAGCNTASQPSANEAPEFPDPGTAWVIGGVYADVRNLRQIVPGLTENQVYLLIREPHFSEGSYGLRAWNYVFRIRTGGGNAAYMTCQYQVRFDKQRIVQATYWRDPACARYVM